MGCIGPYPEGNGEHSCQSLISEGLSMFVTCRASDVEAWEEQGKACHMTEA